MVNGSYLDLTFWLGCCVGSSLTYFWFWRKLRKEHREKYLQLSLAESRIETLKKMLALQQSGAHLDPPHVISLYEGLDTSRPQQDAYLSSV
ncbi:MAG: hypothetical protein AB1898_16120 [Acidobacteriota bacterium]